MFFSELKAQKELTLDWEMLWEMLWEMFLVSVWEMLWVLANFLEMLWEMLWEMLLVLAKSSVMLEA